MELLNWLGVPTRLRWYQNSQPHGTSNWLGVFSLLRWHIKIPSPPWNFKLTWSFHQARMIYWGVRELSIDMPSKLAKRQPYSQSMKEFKRPHVHKKVAIVHPKKHLMSTKRCLMSTKKVPNIHAFSFHFAATIRKFSDILATSCPHICCQFWQQKSTYSGILTANCPHIGF